MTKAKRATVDELLAQLNALREAPDTDDARAALTRALSGKRGALAAAAANIVAEHELEGFESALGAAFDVFMEQPIKRDPGCFAKAGIARALYRLGAPTSELFMRGIHHVQREPVWGGTQDTATELRGLCALGLVRAGHPDAMGELAELLADPEPMARVGAAHAIGYGERHDLGMPLLRFKLRLGDDDSRVLSACFAAVLQLAPDSGPPLVAAYAEVESDEIAEAALIALGESRLAGALPELRRVAEASPTTERRAIAYLAIALMRNDAGWDYLLSVVRDASEPRAREAIEALATYRREPSIRARVLDAAGSRADPLLEAFAREALEAY